MRDLRLEPERVLVTTRGEALVTIHGRGFGRLRLADEKRWVWGRFSRSFSVSKGSGSIEIEARWLFGRRSFSLALEPKADLRVPRLAPVAFRDPADSRKARVPAPRLLESRRWPLALPDSVALRVRRHFETFERSASSSV